MLALFLSFRLQGFEGSKPLVNILLAGNRPVTHAVYGSAWRNWADCCLRRSEIYYSLHKAVSCCASVSGSLSYSAIYVCFIGHITHATMEWRVRLLPFSISDERVGKKKRTRLSFSMGSLRRHPCHLMGQTCFSHCFLYI